MILIFRYIVSRFVYHVFIFFEHWYIGGFIVFFGIFERVIQRFEGVFAILITLRNFFKPLFQDRTFMGYILGFIFRTFRILIGGIIYLVIAVIGLVLYLMWAIIPIYSIVKIIQGLIF